MVHSCNVGGVINNRHWPALWRGAVSLSPGGGRGGVSFAFQFFCFTLPHFSDTVFGYEEGAIIDMRIGCSGKCTFRA